MAGQQLATQCHPLFWTFEAVHVHSTLVCQVVDDSEQADGICIKSFIFHWSHSSPHIWTLPSVHFSTYCFWCLFTVCLFGFFKGNIKSSCIPALIYFLMIGAHTTFTISSINIRFHNSKLLFCFTFALWNKHWRMAVRLTTSKSCFNLPPKILSCQWKKQ